MTPAWLEAFGSLLHAEKLQTLFDLGVYDMQVQDETCLRIWQSCNTSPQTNIDTNHYWLIETSYSFSSLQSLRKNFTWPRLCWPSDPQSEGFNVILASRHLVVH